MATIQLKRQLRFNKSKAEAIQYIKNNLDLLPGEPLLCTYKEPNNEWGAINVICIFSKGTLRSDYVLLSDYTDESLFDENGKLKENIIKTDEIIEWGEI